MKNKFENEKREKIDLGITENNKDLDNYIKRIEQRARELRFFMEQYGLSDKGTFSGKTPEDYIENDAVYKKLKTELKMKYGVNYGTVKEARRQGKSSIKSWVR